MRNWRNYVGAGIGVVGLSAVLSVTGAVPAVAQSVIKPISALIVNTSANPVPVSLQAPVDVATPLWTGTPAIESVVVLNNNFDGFQICNSVFEAAPGTAMLVTTVSGRYNVPPGGFGTMSLRLTLPDGSVKSSIPIPASRTAGAGQVAGVYDQFAGDLYLDKFPVIAASACVSGINAAATVSFIGFTVPLPE
jgi:hypothetical protein